MATIPSMKDLLEAGVHFGHQIRRWHPSMKQFIFGSKDGVHIIDLAQTVSNLQNAYDFVKNLSSKREKIIFLATKKQAREIIKEEAQKAGALFLTDRWIGGLITNFEEVSKNIKKMADLEEKRANEEEMKVYTKKEAVLMDREIAKLERLYGGLRGLDRLPAAIFIVDVKREETAAKEAKKRGVTVVAIADTNANLDLIDRPIPANDDSIKSIRIITQTIADAYQEGKSVYEKGGMVREEKEAEKEEVIVEGEQPKVQKPEKVTKAKKETQSTRKASVADASKLKRRSAGESKRTKAKKAITETKVRKATKVTRAETKPKTKTRPKRKK